MRWVLLFSGAALVVLWLRPEPAPSGADLRAAYAAQVPQLGSPAPGRGPTAVVHQIPAPPSEPRLPRVAATAIATATAMPSTPPPPTPPHATSAPPPASPTAVVPRYVLPVQPWSVVTYGPCHHDYPASDIFAPAGTSVVAVTDGVVDFVSRQDHWTPAEDGPATRGGLSVAIVDDHGTVRYYYSHLSTVQDHLRPGVQVRAGEVIGAVGTSGNARSTPPHVHFGISQPTTPDDWATRRGTVDPAPLLHAWSQGRMIAPDTSAPGRGICGATAAVPSATAPTLPQRGSQPAPAPTPIAPLPRGTAPDPIVQESPHWRSSRLCEQPAASLNFTVQAVGKRDV